MKLASRRSSPSCSQITFGCLGSVPAQPLPRCVDSGAPAATAAWIWAPLAAGGPLARAGGGPPAARAPRGEPLDERDRAGRLGSERHQVDRPFGRVLAPLE